MEPRLTAAHDQPETLHILAHVAGVPAPAEFVPAKDLPA